MWANIATSLNSTFFEILTHWALHAAAETAVFLHFLLWLTSTAVPECPFQCDILGSEYMYI